MQTSPLTLMTIDQAGGLFVDAVVTDESYLLFMSVWGRDTELQEFLARLQLANKEGGLESFWVRPAAGKYQFVRVGNVDRLEKLTGRMPRDNLFGQVGQLWLFDPTAVTPDYAGRRAVIFFTPEEDAPENREALQERLWCVVRETCHLPLLPTWRDVVLDGFGQRGWIRRLDGLGIDAMQITLPEPEVELAVSEWIRQGGLVIPGRKATPPAVNDDFLPCAA